MGTRNLTCVVVDGKYRVAQYCQWDGYPSGQGLTALNFLRKKRTTLASFRDRVRNNTKFLTTRQVEKRWEECGATGDWVGREVSDKFEKSYPSLHRNTGAEILDIIDKSNDVVPLANSIDFVGNGLSCEWAYVIDLDNNVLEVYRGVYEGKAPRTRFNKRRRKSQVELVASYSFDDLPSDAKFCTDLGDGAEDE